MTDNTSYVSDVINISCNLAYMLLSTSDKSINSVNTANGWISMSSLYDKLRWSNVFENTWMLSIDCRPIIIVDDDANDYIMINDGGVYNNDGSDNYNT